MHFPPGYGFTKKMLQIGFSPCPSLLSSLILRYFGDHSHVNSAVDTLQSNGALARSNTERSHRF